MGLYIARVPMSLCPLSLNVPNLSFLSILVFTCIELVFLGVWGQSGTNWTCPLSEIEVFIVFFASVILVLRVKFVMVIIRLNDDAILN